MTTPNEPVDIKALEGMVFPPVNDEILGRCSCGEGKKYALFYFQGQIHRKCRTCGTIVNMEKK